MSADFGSTRLEVDVSQSNCGSLSVSEERVYYFVGLNEPGLDDGVQSPKSGIHGAERRALNDSA